MRTMIKKHFDKIAAVVVMVPMVTFFVNWALNIATGN